MMSDDSTFIYHSDCPACGSSDANAVYSDGHTYCFSCSTSTKAGTADTDGTPASSASRQSAPSFEPIRGEYRALKSRGITQETCEKWKYQVATVGGNTVQVCNYFDEDGRLCAQKLRDREKNFSFRGKKKDSTLYGTNIWRGKQGKKLVVTEGEIDALSVSQAQGHKWPVVSVPTGAQGAAKELGKHKDWLDKFEEIVLFFDQDEPGRAAAEQCAKLFKPGQVKIVHCELKDANEYLKQGRVKDLVEAIWNAEDYKPGGVVSGTDTWDRLMDRPEVKSLPFPAHWRKMNRMGYGVRLGELDVWTSGSGMGKTQFFREIKLHILDNTDASIADIALEEPLEDTVESLCALRMNKRIHLPDVEYTQEELREAWETTAGTGRYYLYDAFGSLDQDDLLSKIRYFATALDCKYIFLDHLSIVVSGYAADGNERSIIDEIMTALKSLTVELGIWIGVIVHLRKVDGGSRGKSFETGLVPTLDDLRGSGSLKQLANSVYAVSRNQQAETDIERHTSQLHVLKCRYTGRTGPADWLRFNEETGRMEEGFDPSELEGGHLDGDDLF